MESETPRSLSNVQHVILILSGKGGVGKSSVTTQTALTLALKGFNVGVLDIDLTGPSMPRMFGVENKKVHQSTNGWVPVTVSRRQENVGESGASSVGSIALMSLGFLLGSRDSSVVWRGPKKTAMIRQFLKDVIWNNGNKLDYLLIDTPPGTSDEHIAIAEELRYVQAVDGAIIVTTPQQVATADVRKEINFCKKVNFSILGIIENMSGFICPYCADCTNIFSSGGGEALSQNLGIPFLGKLPIDPTFVEMIENQNDQRGQNDQDHSKDSNDHKPQKDSNDSNLQSKAIASFGESLYSNLPELYKSSNLCPIMNDVMEKLLCNENTSTPSFG